MSLLVTLGWVFKVSPYVISASLYPSTIGSGLLV